MGPYGYCKSERAYIGWLRSATRKIWAKHPIRLEMLKENRKRLLNPKSGRMAFQCMCAHCKKYHPLEDLEVNHKNTVGTLTLENFGTYCERLLLIKPDELEILCKACHEIVTYQERSGMTAEEAAIEKKIIAFFNKYPAVEQKRRFELAGMVPAKNQAERRLQLREYLREKARNSGVRSIQQ
ncbi:hypothetical protein QNH08_gp45 [Aeromonas phage pAh6.2TG]|uniref:HNH endonuclease n=2 Tax=Phayathaivirus TaxID=3153015 RepID=A0A8F3HM80_9CAUD|nr:hypothetical protein QNH08_gp45 [Aeromonas phage pAh6.2TG]YP_010845324.1 hypothetical protein QNH09_gp42 [Aeromonas phage PVN03]QTQ06824.1 hypothetical protein [Aeromonas phage PVN03]QTQ06955.1 hypothetical protein [Aeromonas phage PVN05]QWY14077.1 hypothetical protein [Aeromonas phage pAh6.2TG]